MMLNICTTANYMDIWRETCLSPALTPLPSISILNQSAGMGIRMCSGMAIKRNKEEPAQ
ncbi:hypothetical protein AOLI_G00174350 [Acnodon oligacanthus]